MNLVGLSHILDIEDLKFNKNTPTTVLLSYSNSFFISLIGVAEIETFTLFRKYSRL